MTLLYAKTPKQNRICIGALSEEVNGYLYQPSSYFGTDVFFPASCKEDAISKLRGDFMKQVVKKRIPNVDFAQASLATLVIQ